MNQTNIKVDSDDKKMKLDKFVVKKIVFDIVRRDQFLYLFFFSLITKLILDFYSVFLSLFPIFSLIALLSFIYPSSFSLSALRAVQVG